MSTSRSFASFAATSTLLVLACSSSSSSSVSTAQASADVSTAFCSRYNACAPLFVQITYGDVPTCETRFKIEVANALGANGTGATPAQYESCSHDLTAASCDDILSRNLPPSCQTAAGTLTDGTACGADTQCANKLCRKQTGQTCGVCSSPAAAGGACTADGDCVYGLNCTNSVCTAYGKAGGTCDATHPCMPTLTCNGGTCAIPSEAGGTCPTLGSAGCDLLKGTFCASTMVCAQIGLSNAGQPCGVSGAGTGFNECNAGGFCKGAAGLTAGTCAAPAADGATCDAANGPPCLSPAICQSGACKVPDPGACK